MSRTQKTEFVFQYGSNMSVARMQDVDERIPEAKPIEAAWTVDLFDFCFPVRSKRHNRAVSGILTNPSGRNIFGAIYEIPYDLIDRGVVRSHRKSLDEIEGEGTNYDRTAITVIGVKSGRRIQAITYLPRPQDKPGLTDAEYAGYILSGLAEWKAPGEYVDYVTRVIAEVLPKQPPHVNK